MDLKRMVDISSKMRQNNSFLLDVSELTETEAACITVLVKDLEIYEFFVKVKDVSIEKLYVACKYLEYKETLEKLNFSRKR
ncbi:hypothetical protein [Robinsoniella peoriensis]|uniref:hypothetical protein n=1 Tax=Robinsoniella peoriensis TaxID=180332 RepID=UPI00114C97FA|nr:hypothetical protein [Robinsoniella peoriensis]